MRIWEPAFPAPLVTPPLVLAAGPNLPGGGSRTSTCYQAAGVCVMNAEARPPNPGGPPPASANDNTNPLTTESCMDTARVCVAAGTMVDTYNAVPFIRNIGSVTIFPDGGVVTHNPNGSVYKPPRK